MFCSLGVAPKGAAPLRVSLRSWLRHRFAALQAANANPHCLRGKKKPSGVVPRALWGAFSLWVVSVAPFAKFGPIRYFNISFSN